MLEPGACEIEGATHRLSAAGERSTESHLQWGCGIGWTSQIAVAASKARDQGVRSSGLAIGGKTGLWKAEGQDDGAALTLAWGMGNTKESGHSWRHGATFVNLALSAPVAADLTLHTNLGHARDEQTRHRATTWALAIEHAGFGEAVHAAPMAELFGNDREPACWNLGLRFTAVPEKLFFDASYGRQFASGRPALVTLGFKFAF